MVICCIAEPYLIVVNPPLPGLLAGSPSLRRSILMLAVPVLNNKSKRGIGFFSYASFKNGLPKILAFWLIVFKGASRFFAIL